MKLHFAVVPAMNPAQAAEELNAFLAEHRVVSIDRELVANADGAFWAVCVTYLERGTNQQPSTRRGKVDYRTVLNEGDFAVFAELRKLRKTFAEKEAIPPYSVFINAQLAAMVTGRVRSKAELRAIDGVGDARMDRYGEAFLARLNELWGEHATSNTRDGG